MSVEALLGLFVQYGYGILFAAILLDNAGLPIPGELLLLMLGALGRTGDLSLGLGLLVASAAAVSGDSIGYWLGRLTGDRILRTYCRVTLASGACVRRAVGHYATYGNATVIVGRFVMGVRAFLSPLAGSAGMPFGRFLVFDILGATLWSSLFVAIGYAFGWQLESVDAGYRTGATALLGALAIGLALYLAVKLARRRHHGSAAFRERALGRVARVLGLGRPGATHEPRPRVFAAASLDGRVSAEG